jgi:hypothetical protein
MFLFFFYFSDRPFNSWDFSKFPFCLVKPVEWFCSSQDTNLFMLISWHLSPSRATTNRNPPVCNNCRAGCVRFLCANPRILGTSLSRMWAFRIPIELALRMPGKRQWHSTPYRIPNWHPARRKIHLAEQWFYLAKFNLWRMNSLKAYQKNLKTSSNS